MSYICEGCKGKVSTPKGANDAKVKKVHESTCPGRNRK